MFVLWLIVRTWPDPTTNPDVVSRPAYNTTSALPTPRSRTVFPSFANGHGPANKRATNAARTPLRATALPLLLPTQLTKRFSRKVLGARPRVTHYGPHTCQNERRPAHAPLSSPALSKQDRRRTERTRLRSGVTYTRRPYAVVDVNRAHAQLVVRARSWYAQARQT